MKSVEELLTRSQRRKSLPKPRVRRALRLQAGLTQAEVAEAIGVSRPAVVRWESGERTPRNPHLDKYVELLRRLAAETIA